MRLFDLSSGLMVLAAAGMPGSAGTGKETLQNLATRVSEAVASLLRSVLGSNLEWLQAELWQGITWAHLITSLLFLLFILLLNALIRLFIRKRQTKAEQTEKEGSDSWKALLAEAVGRPVYSLVWVCGIYLALVPLVTTADGRFFLGKLYDAGVFLTLLWFFFRLTGVLDRRLKFWAKGTDSAMDDLLLPLAIKSLRIIVPVVGIIFGVKLLGLPPQYEQAINTISSILIVCAVAWVLTQVVLLSEKLIMSRYDIKQGDNLRARQVYTQVTLLKKTALFIITILTVALILMSFESVRRLGTSILASAGVVGVIIGFAAQKALANLFAGIQLALTQPIRLDDVVIVENEWGWIEEITLTYVVVRIWDLRRLILPISHFIERPFQNWTRVSADILGTVYFHADYAIPIQPLREELKRVVAQSPNWDKKVVGLVVTDAKPATLELRALVSALDSGKAWDLRCEVREAMITFIQKNYPQHLPKFRASLEGNLPGPGAQGPGPKGQ